MEGGVCSWNFTVLQLRALYKYKYSSGEWCVLMKLYGFTT